MENEKMATGSMVYKSANYGSRIIDIQVIESETKKYFKLADGTLIQKENGQVRGTAGSGSFRDAMDTQYYHLITKENKKEIELGYKFNQVLTMKNVLEKINITELKIKENELIALEVLFKSALEILSKSKKIKKEK